MTEREQQTLLPEELPEAVVASRSRVSLVWLIPIVALLIGGWLAYKAYAERGPTIRIELKTAAGLQAGKTKVKFKDVEVGDVKSIMVRGDLQGVVVTAELVAGAEVYLREKTRFWVARPRVTASRVSGLDTLLSGAYIAIDPVTEGEEAREFVGLEEPPLFTTSEPGKKFILRSKTLGSLNIGSPVYYRQIQVGQVVGYELDQDGDAVSIELFIAQPNDRLVLTNTRFWNASGVDFKLSAEGISVDTQSLLSVLVGRSTRKGLSGQEALSALFQRVGARTDRRGSRPSQGHQARTGAGCSARVQRRGVQVPYPGAHRAGTGPDSFHWRRARRCAEGDTH